MHGNVTKTSTKDGVAKIVARFARHFFLNLPISNTWIHPCTSSNSIKPSAKKRAKVPSWTHVFVCLACVEQDIVPDWSESAVLQIAGLGEKNLQFSFDADCFILMMSWWPVFQSCVIVEVLNSSVLMIDLRHL